MRLLTIDVESAPHLVWTWGLRNQFIRPEQVVEWSHVISFAARFEGEKRIHFGRYDDGSMAEALYDLLDEADVVCHYNGESFDMPKINTELKLAGLGKPSPYRQIDLLKTSRKEFDFGSNKLDSIAKRLGIGSKVAHEGFRLWLAVLAGDEKAWKRMERYNKHDVILTERLYREYLPWIANHPNRGLYADGSCPTCGSDDLERRGYAYTSVGTYRRYRCRDCGAWSRGKGLVDSTPDYRPA